MIGPDDEQSTSLHDHWTSLLEGETRMEDLAISDRDQTGKRVMDAYGNATEMLIQVADILQVSELVLSTLTHPVPTSRPPELVQC